MLGGVGPPNDSLILAKVSQFGNQLQPHENQSISHGSRYATLQKQIKLPFSWFLVENERNSKMMTTNGENSKKTNDGYIKEAMSNVISFTHIWACNSSDELKLSLQRKFNFWKLNQRSNHFTRQTLVSTTSPNWFDYDVKMSQKKSQNCQMKPVLQLILTMLNCV